MGIHPHNVKIDLSATLINVNNDFPTVSPAKIRTIIESYADGCVFGNIAVVLDEDWDDSTWQAMMEELGTEIGDDEAAWELCVEV